MQRHQLFKLSVHQCNLIVAYCYNSYYSHSPVSMPINMRSIFRPMREVEKGDKQMQGAEDFLRDHQSVMERDGRILLEDHMLWWGRSLLFGLSESKRDHSAGRAKEVRFGIEEKSWSSWKAKVQQARQYSKRVQTVLDTVEVSNTIPLNSERD